MKLCNGNTWTNTLNSEHRECCKTSFICCVLVAAENLIWPVFFFIFFFMVTSRGVIFAVLWKYLLCNKIYKILSLSVVLMIHSMHPSFSAGGLTLLPNFKKEGLDRTSIFREDLLGKRGWPFCGDLYIISGIKKGGLDSLQI